MFVAIADDNSKEVRRMIMQGIGGRESLHSTNFISVNFTDAAGFTPLHKAAKEGSRST